VGVSDTSSSHGDIQQCRVTCPGDLLSLDNDIVLTSNVSA